MFKIRPEILTHPNIPKPLHGLNPRTILGKEWWDKTRKAAYASTGYRCAACGIHKTQAQYHNWLEGHEYWDISYSTGVCEVKEIVPLCHSCHNFIHSGRLYMLWGSGKVYTSFVEDILTRGFGIIKEHNLQPFAGTLDVAKMLHIDTMGLVGYDIAMNPSLEWGDFVMKLEGKTYSSLFKDITEWESYYSKM